MIAFDFIISTKTIFGYQSINKLNRIIKDNNYEKIALLVDHNMKHLEIVKKLSDKLKMISEFNIIECDISEPTYEKLEEKRFDSAKYKIDVIIAIGGGSTIDMAKGLSVLYSNIGPAISYRGFNQFNEPILPIIALPSTAGSGSEITPSASFIDTQEKRKMGINGEALRPKYAILDPELTLSCPKSSTISAGVDSMVHATEAFVAKKSNPMSTMFAKKGFKLVFDNLPLLINNLSNIQLRERVMYGAFLSAVGLINSGTGPAAAMSYPLGVHYGVPHGIGGGIFLPHVIDHNINEGFFDYADLYQPIKNNSTKEERYFPFYCKAISINHLSK